MRLWLRLGRDTASWFHLWTLRGIVAKKAPNGRFEALFPLHAQINLRVFIDVDDHLVYQDSSLFSAAAFPFSFVFFVYFLKNRARQFRSENLFTMKQKSAERGKKYNFYVASYERSRDGATFSHEQCFQAIFFFACSFFFFLFVVERNY